MSIQADDRRRRRLLHLFGIAISLVAVILVVSQVDISSVIVELGSADLGLLVLACVVVSTQVVVVARRWQLLLPDAPPDADGTIPAKPPFADVVRIVLVGYLGNLALPGRVGELIRAYLMAQRHRLGFPETLGSIVLERLIDVAILAVLAFALVVVGGLPGWMLALTGVAALGAGSFLVLVSTIGLVAPVRWVRAHLPARVEQRGAPIVDAVERVAVGASGHARRRAVVAAIWWTVVQALLEGMVFWLSALALGVEIAYWQAFLIAAVAILATAVPSAPGYLGTFEAATLAVAVAMGIDPAPALAFAILAHAITVIPLAVGGGVVVITMGLRLQPLATEAAAAEAASAEREGPVDLSGPGHGSPVSPTTARPAA